MGLSRRTNSRHTAAKPGAPALSNAYEAGIHSIIALSSGFYWEKDTKHRFTRYLHREVDSSNGDPLGILGRTTRDLGGVPAREGETWEQHIAALEARQPFENSLVRYPAPDGGHRYVSSSGRPMFDEHGTFRGYQGIARDVTAEMRGEILLRLEQTVLRILGESEDAEQGLTQALRAICEAEDWQAGSFWGRDPVANVLRFKIGWSISGHPGIGQAMQQARQVTFGPGEGLPGCVWQSGETLWVSKVTEDPRIEIGVARSVHRMTGWNSVVLVPITSEGEVIGVVDFYAPVIAEPDSRLLQVIGVLGAEVGHFYRRVLAVQKLRDSEERFRSLTQLTSDWYWEQDAEFRFVRFDGGNPEHIEFLSRMFVGKRGWETDLEALADLEGRSLRALQEQGQPFRDIIVRGRMPDGTEGYYSVSGEPIFDDQGVFCGYRGVSRDVTDSKRAEQQVQYLATHDALTDLPNRHLFSQVLNLAIGTARRYERKLAVLFIDLDGFKNINDSLGHEAGDAVLMEISRRIRACLRASDLVARMGGDEFLVLIPEVGEAQQLSKVAQNILAAAAGPVVAAGRECRITASIGISLFPVDAEDEKGLLRCADQAMYQAKEQGKNRYCFYSSAAAQIDRAL
jgi:diguanylate cyclase (GGDEF)-like protein/PAS domain S-box-containing protein